MAKDATPLRYATVVADPPWQSPDSRGRVGRTKGGGDGWQRHELPYPSLSVEEIAALPIAQLAAPDSRLFLWTTNRWLREAFDVVDAWGFAYTQTLIWEKAAGGPYITSVAPSTAEFVLVGRRGSPVRMGRFKAQVFQMPRGRHSVKPEAFLDVVESVSPGPYLELFARRARVGWDAWGDEVDSNVELTA